VVLSIPPPAAQPQHWHLFSWLVQVYVLWWRCRSNQAKQKPSATDCVYTYICRKCARPTARFPMWAPKAADGEGSAATHEVPTGPTWQQMARNSAATFVAKLDGQGMGVATGAMNDTFNRELWAQPIFVEAFVMKGGMPLICRLASAASDDNLFYK